MDLEQVLGDRGGNVHPYMAQGVAHERIADFIRAAEADRKARDGAERGGRRLFGSRRRRSAARQASYPTARLVIAYSGSAESDSDHDRSEELAKVGC